MSILGRIRALFRGRGLEERRNTAADGADGGRGGMPPRPSAEARGGAAGAASERLAAMARGEAPVSAEEVKELLSTLAGAGRSPRAEDAEDLAVALLRRPDRPEPARLRFVVAAHYAAVGRDREALSLLSPREDPETSLEAAFLRAEILSRLGEREAAREALGWILARDYDYPGVRERLEALSEGDGMARPVAGGATLVGSGASISSRYVVSRELGRGGAGTVFLAHDAHLERPVALKLYHRRGAADRRRLLREAGAAAALEHPGVLRIFDVDPELSLIAMELLSGRSLEARLLHGTADHRELLEWSIDLVATVAFVHRRGCVHRDLKPSNILFRSDGKVVITDFGISAPIGAEAEGIGEGTTGYAAPEQLRGAAASPAADVYSLGVTLREALRTSAAAPSVALRDALEACASTDPTKRPSIDELGSALRDALAPERALAGRNRTR